MPEKSSRKFAQFVLPTIAIASLVLFLAGVGYIIFGGAVEETPSAVQGATTVAGDLHLSSQFAAPWALENNPATFWLQAENTGKSALTSVMLLPLDAPGFSVESYGCQSPGGACPVNAAPSASAAATPATSAAAETPSGILLADSLAPGQKITVWVHLRAQSEQHSEFLSPTVSWKMSATSPASTLAVPAGPVSVRSAHDEWILSRLGLLQGLALPLATFLIGGIFSAVKYYSDLANKAADEERAHTAQIADAKREQLTQTWNQMLPASHKLALGFYMPLSSAVHETLYRMGEAAPKQSSPAPASASSPGAPLAAPAAVSVAPSATANVPSATASTPGAAGNIPAAAPPPIDQWDDKDLRRAFYGLMLFESRIRKMNVRVGGFYFKNRGGEKIVSQCYVRYGQSFYRSSKDAQELMERVRDHVNSEADLSDFNAAWRRKQNLFNDFWTRFQKWVVDPEGYTAAAPILHAFRTVLDYEANRPYEYWYGSREPLEIDPKVETALRGDWLNITDENERKQFRDVVSEYLDENKKPNPPAAPASKKP